MKPGFYSAGRCRHPFFHQNEWLNGYTCLANHSAIQPFSHSTITVTTARDRPGYILLVSILAIGVIASAIVSSLLFLGTSAETYSLSVQQSSQAVAAAQACTEYALKSLRTNPSYSGNQIIAIGRENCEILPIGGTDNNNRMLCVEGQSGDAFRRMEIIIRQILPTTEISSWQEVSAFTLCL